MLRVPSILILVLVLGLGAVAQEADIEVLFAEQGPVIDGEVDDVWTTVAAQPWGAVFSGNPTPEDNSFEWRVLWNGEGLFLLIDVTDDIKVNDSALHWLDDSVEFYFDGGNSKDAGPALVGDNRQHSFGWDATDIQGTNTATAGCEHAQVDTETGWRLELYFPWSSLLGSVPQAGDLFGIDVFRNDDDGANRESQVGTFADDGGDWSNPADWGTAVLVYGAQPKSFDPNPNNGVSDVLRDATLSWKPGDSALTHNVYLGTREDALELVGEGLSVARYDAERPMLIETPYYWRVDDVAADGTVTPGDTWRFKTEPLAMPLTNVTVEGSSAFAEVTGAEKTIDGSGLDDMDRHGTAGETMWLSGVDDTSPTLTYTFDKVYKLHEMWVWNQNQSLEDIAGFGAKDVTVEVSVDGDSWMLVPDVPSFAQGSGEPGYAANTVVAFGGAVAKYVKLTVTSSYDGPGTQAGLSEVRFTIIPTYARELQPADGTVLGGVNVTFQWRPGREAVTHDVVLSTDLTAVEDSSAVIGSTHDKHFSPDTLAYNSQYYYRINEVNEAETPSTWYGDILVLSTPTQLVIDDMEAYDTYPEDDVAIEDELYAFNVWADGYGVEHNGSEVGPSPDNVNKNRGAQAMPLHYNNAEEGDVSEITRSFDPPLNLSAGTGLKTVEFYFSPAWDNTGGQLYVKINGVQVDYDGPADALVRLGFRKWSIVLADVAGVDLSAVTSLTIGIKGLGAGTVVIDDVVATTDARNLVTPIEPTVAPILHLAFDGDLTDSAGDLDGTYHTNQAENDPIYSAGVNGQALEFDIAKQERVNIVGYPGVLPDEDGVQQPYTVATWVKTEEAIGAICGFGTFAGGQRIVFRFSNGRLICQGGNGNRQGNVNANNGEWQHVAMTMAEGGAWADCVIYLNGVAGLGNAANANSVVIVPGNDFGIGFRAPRGWQWQFTGSMDEFMLFDQALSEAEIAGLAGVTSAFDSLISGLN